MRRRFFFLMSLLSLLLCFASVMLWVRSYWVKDQVQHVFGPTLPTKLRGNMVRESVVLTSSSGRCQIRYTPHLSVVLGFEPSIEDGSWFYDRQISDAADIPTPGSTLGFGATQTIYGGWEFHLSDYAVVGTLGLATVVSFALTWQWKLKKGLCTCCGYSLTGNTSGVCPECGTAVAEGRRRMM